MIRFLVAAFLVGHGLVHGIMFGLPYSAKASADIPYNPSHSWLIGDNRGLGFGLGLVVTVAFFVAGVAYLGEAAWWRGATIVAAVLSTLLVTIFFSRWWTVGILIDAALVVAVLRA